MKKELSDALATALENADSLLWAIWNREDHSELGVKAVELITNIQEITMHCIKEDNGKNYTCPELEDSKKALDDFINIPF